MSLPAAVLHTPLKGLQGKAQLARGWQRMCHQQRRGPTPCAVNQRRHPPDKVLRIAESVARMCHHHQCTYAAGYQSAEHSSGAHCISEAVLSSKGLYRPQKHV